MNEPLSDPFPVRFRKKTKDRVKKMADRFHINPSELIRRAVDAQLPSWEAQGTLVIEAEE